MKRIGVLVLLVFFGCATAGTPTTATGRFSTCTTDAIKNTAGHLLDNVATAVATQNYVAALADLVTRFGVNEVKCAVDLFIDSVTGRKAEADPLAAGQLSRAQAWRSANP